MHRSLVSIIVPCYNYAHFLKETLQDLLLQEYGNWECLVINDGSSDDTEIVARQFVEVDKRFRYYYQDNHGLSSARNLGIKEARGEYYQFLDSDDFIHPSKLDKQVKLLEALTEVDIVYGNSLFFFDDDRAKLFESRSRQPSVYNNHLRVSGTGQTVLKHLLKDNLMEVSCCLLRNRVVEKVGLFDESFKSYEDWQYWIRCATAGVVLHYMPEPGTETYIRCGHSSMMKNRKKLAESGLLLRKQLHPQLSFTQKVYNRYRMAKLYTRLAALKIF